VTPLLISEDAADQPYRVLGFGEQDQNSRPRAKIPNSGTLTQKDLGGDYQDTAMGTKLLVASSAYGSPVCFGDSGAPVLDTNNKVIGIISAAKSILNCSTTGIQATRLSPYLPWINQYLDMHASPSVALPTSGELPPGHDYEPGLHVSCSRALIRTGSYGARD
jgi:hypothetical protein